MYIMSIVLKVFRFTSIRSTLSSGVVASEGIYVMSTGIFRSMRPSQILGQPAHSSPTSIYQILAKI
jgi:hypothetical protein